MRDRSKYAGIILTAAVHGLLLLFAFKAGIERKKTVPLTDRMLIEFPDEEQTPVEKEPVPVMTETGVEPKAAEASPTEDIRLVQRSESPLAAEADNSGEEATVGDDGDVPVPEPERERPIDTRALFPSADNLRDSTDAQAAEEPSDKLEEGHVHGNTEAGNPEGTPTARLEGRSVMGNLPLPQYDVAESGTVVVRIIVDQYGNVVNAIPGVKGTTVNDAVLWNAAKEAALKAKFNISASAPAAQEGTISYIFRMK